MRKLLTLISPGHQESEAFISDVHENVVEVVNISTLSNRQYCVILDPVGDDGKNRLGQRKLVKVM